MQSGTSMKVMRTFLERSFDIVKLWDSWGIPMKHEGRWEFAGHSFPGDVLTHLKYQGRGQKRILTEKALRKGSQDHQPGDDARSVDREGGPRRRDRNSHPGGEGGRLSGQERRFWPRVVWTGSIRPLSRRGWRAPPTVSPSRGMARAMAYRAGATIVGPESPKRHMGPRYFSRFGQATWIGVLRDPQGKPIGPFVTRPDRTYGDMTMEVRSGILEDYHEIREGACLHGLQRHRSRGL